MIILALDPSINSAGWAKRKNGKVSAGVIRTKGKGVPERCGQLVDRVQGLASNVDIALVEVTAAFSYNRSSRGGRSLNQHSLAILNRATGAICGALAQAGVRVIEVPVKEWKGRRSKKLDQIVALAEHGVSHPDAADALGILAWWERIGRFREAVNDR